MTKREGNISRAAVNTNVDFDVQVGVQQPPPECPPGFTFNPDTDLCEQRQTRPLT
ncbi:MAG: hypothetical protein M3114_04375 [Thermoproteota archaeon]|nr:hypothetical protein [Thermoproteota archaeon]